ncbi:hypothetical protein GSI_05441 [Ganoderma sinense ZZ0214-1]|uniref:Uncharacterized protein n=1 Tax=Ganoderma sinense ZZ0214-1 TaxID=1077348 RepID=A0A2G8SEJ6_9APHY|nr:hypothetical protein GSI_05441 [Ganoderma sinense ZZ0214-1]
MAAPTQVLPSWLTLSTTVVTLPDGSVSTSSATLTLPLTYFGPSIPLGTNGVWTYGGLTPPPSTTSSSTSATPTTPTSSVSSAITSVPSTSSTLAPTSTSQSTSSSASSTSAIPTATPAAGTSHGISPSVLGAILGSILGTLLLLLLLAIVFLLRKYRRHRGPEAAGEAEAKDPSSSFWNRSTTLQSLRRSHQPIWTGWESVDAHDADPSPSPGDGSPRESGDEADPFLTRGSVRSGTEVGHARTDTDTLVSLPAIARTEATSSHRSKAKLAEPIIPRDVQLRMGEEMADVPPYPSIRVVERRPSTDVESPLLPPRPIDPDSLGMSGRRPSLAEKRSIGSEKSLGSIDPQEAEAAEMLTARRVRVGPLQPMMPTASTSVATPNLLGIDRLAANLPRMSWFRRMSSQFAPRSEQDAAASLSDAYTRTPPRHSRNGSRSRPGSQSRPGSFARVSTHEPTSPTTDSFGRRLRHQDSGLAFGAAGERPISTLSGASAASGNTVFFDARSRPGSAMGTHSTGSGSTQHPPVPPMPAAHYPQPSPLQREVRQSTSSRGHSNEHLAVDNPPTYEAATRPQSMAAMEYSDIDVLDMPAPRPASPFSAASGSRSTPPGLPNVSVWRSSVVSSTASPTTATAVDSTSGFGINLDVLDEAPPSADNGWSSLSGGGIGGRQLGRRLTFGTPMVVQPREMLESEVGSLHSMRSHLSPYSSMSPVGSAAASSHTLTGSGSSRPSTSNRSHSRGHTGSSGQSLSHSASTSFDDHRPGRRRVMVGEVAAPLSAVIASFPHSFSPPPSSSSHGEDIVAPLRVYHPARGHSPPSDSVPVPAPALPMPAAVAVSGTVGSRATTTDESMTDLSITTTQTDPITGTVMHFPRLPLRAGNERTARDDALW